MDTQIIENQSFGGERALYHRHGLELRNCTFNEGESCLKECTNINTHNCTFIGKYALWHNHNTLMDHCTLKEDCRAPLWYDENLTMRNCFSRSPKILREVRGINLVDCTFENATETLWRCKDLKGIGVKVYDADYLCLMNENVYLKDFFFRGKYAFQYCKNLTIENADINSKDLFWECENVVIRNSTIRTEYLAWYARNITFENCHLAGTQPLCYCKGLKLIDCTFAEDADLAFENSEVEACIKGPITSVKNPVTGYIKASQIKEIIIDENVWQPNNCKIELDS